MVIGDHEGVSGVFGDRADARRPRFEFAGLVKIVVTLERRNGGIVAKPGVVAAAMKASVADGGSEFRGRFERFSDDGLIDIAESSVVLAKQGEGFFGVPGGVAELDDEREVGEALQQVDEMCY